MSKEQQFFDAARSGNLSVVKKLAADTTLNKNWQESSQGFTPFNQACYEGHMSVVQFLLTLPTVDVNKPKDSGATPFYIACQEGHKEVVSLLLADPRVDTNKPDSFQCTPLFVFLAGRSPVSWSGHISLRKGN